MEELSQEQINLGKFTLIYITALPATFKFDLFETIYTGEYEGLNGRILKNPEAVFQALVDLKDVEDLGNGRYGVTEEKQSQLLQELTESGFIDDED